VRSSPNSKYIDDEAKYYEHTHRCYRHQKEKQHHIKINFRAIGRAKRKTQILWTMKNHEPEEKSQILRPLYIKVKYLYQTMGTYRKE